MRTRGVDYNRQETQLAILGVALAITLYNALVLEPTAQVALEEELVRPTFFLLRSFHVLFSEKNPSDPVGCTVVALLYIPTIDGYITCHE